MSDAMPISLTPPQTDEDIVTWLQTQMSDGQPLLLAHADDGVIWGKLMNGKLVTSSETEKDDANKVSPPLRGITLQQAFVFGPEGEVRLWRDDAEWQCHRFRIADEIAFVGHIDEKQVLWGTKVLPEKTQHGFTYIRERRQQGLDQVVPVEVDDRQLGERRLRLHVRHFIERDDETGEARIAFSRLVDLVIEKEEQ
jgi:CRISPR-associated protein (TIGR03984 family)